MSWPCILIIEDDSSLREILKVGLEYEGFEVLSVASGEKALDIISSHPVDLIILDIMLPDISGFDLCKSLRSKGIEIPILMLTARREVKDRVKGLNLGADDYLIKPFDFEELLARIRALLRRYKRAQEDLLKKGDLCLNPETKEVLLKGEKLKLTPIEFKLLELFMRHPGRVFSKQVLLNRIWGYEYADPNLVDVHISRLRKKLRDKPPKMIRTYYGVGYAFCPEE